MLEVINAIQNACEHVYPESTDYLGDCVIYSFHTTQSDRISEQIRLKLTIVSTTMNTGLEMEEEIKNALLTLGDNAFNSDILQIALNGGGILQDVAREKIHRILYFDIIKRY